MIRMIHSLTVAVVCLSAIYSFGEVGNPILTVAELASESNADVPIRRPFAIESTVTSVAYFGKPHYKFTVSDTNASARILCSPNIPLSPGDKIRMTGEILNRGIPESNFALAKNVEILSHGNKLIVHSIDGKSFNSGQFRDSLVTLRGTIVDAFRDEIDPNFVFFILSAGNELVCATLQDKKTTDTELDALIDANVRVTGLCSTDCFYSRRSLISIQLGLSSFSDIELLRPAPNDPFDAPIIEPTPEQARKLLMRDTRRYRLIGDVLAVWHNDRMLLRTGGGHLSTISLKGCNPPVPNTRIEAVGFPETDYYSFNLNHAVWRKVDGTSTPCKEPEEISAEAVFIDKYGRRRIDQLYHGRLVRLSGILRSLPIIGSGNECLTLDCGRVTVGVNCNQAAATIGTLCLGDKLEVTGVCVMETATAKPHTFFPRIENISIILRSSSDIKVLSRPPQRIFIKLLYGITTFFAILVFYLFWRSHRAKLFSKLRVDERTRLAVELHDSIAQNLTGVALEINAAQISDNPGEARSHLTTATQTLKSCRRELRNCIWDLRSDALEQKNLEEAILRMLLPQIGDARIAIRFPVPRNRFTDNSAHALLRVIRELVTNSLRHGHATSIKIAGSHENDRVLFSVQDNGSGFDPLTAPGIEQGHFGLQGIRERLEGLEGGIEIHSKAGKGTKVTAWIKSEC